MTKVYPKARLGEQIIAGEKYSYRYDLSVPYTTLGTFKPSISLNGYAIEREFPGISYLRFACVYVESTIPVRIDVVVVFKEAPGLTHREFSNRIKEIATERYWTLILRDIVILEAKPFSWGWLALLLVVMILWYFGSKK